MNHVDIGEPLLICRRRFDRSVTIRSGGFVKGGDTLGTFLWSELAQVFMGKLRSRRRAIESVNPGLTILRKLFAAPVISEIARLVGIDPRARIEEAARCLSRCRPIAETIRMRQKAVPPVLGLCRQTSMVSLNCFGAGKGTVRRSRM
jgi:hypothetical protein